MNERRVGNKQIPDPNQWRLCRQICAWRLIKKIPFIFDWHQGRVLPTPAYGITPKTQKSEHQTDDVNLRETGNVSEEKNCDNKREGDNGDNYPR